MSATDPLLTFKSHIEGKNADVAIYVDRIEWDRKGRLTVSRVAATLTPGAPAPKTGLRKGGGSEMVPVKAISAVTVERDGFRQLVKVICSGNTIDFRVGRGEADGIKALLTQLMVGTHTQLSRRAMSRRPIVPRPHHPARPCRGPAQSLRNWRNLPSCETRACCRTPSSQRLRRDCFRKPARA